MYITVPRVSSYSIRCHIHTFGSHGYPSAPTSTSTLNPSYLISLQLYVFNTSIHRSVKLPVDIDAALRRHIELVERSRREVEVVALAAATAVDDADLDGLASIYRGYTWVSDALKLFTSSSSLGNQNLDLRCAVIVLPHTFAVFGLPGEVNPNELKMPSGTATMRSFGPFDLPHAPRPGAKKVPVSVKASRLIKREEWCREHCAYRLLGGGARRRKRRQRERRGHKRQWRNA
jgi:hypothetical protein